MNKACLVVLRRISGELQILTFQHPIAGKQLVKGTMEQGETPEAASVRELWEEAGINLRCEKFLQLWQWTPEATPTWAFCLMENGDQLPDRWRHFCSDDGGHYFEFFWQPLAESPQPSEWHPLFIAALAAIRGILNHSK